MSSRATGMSEFIDMQWIIYSEILSIVEHIWWNGGIMFPIWNYFLIKVVKPYYPLCWIACSWTSSKTQGWWTLNSFPSLKYCFLWAFSLLHYKTSSKFASVIEFDSSLHSSNWLQRFQHWKVGILFSQLLKRNIFEDRGTVL